MAADSTYDSGDAAGIAAVVVVVAVLSWFTADVSGGSRVATVALAAFVSGVTATLSLWAFRYYR